MGRKKKHNFNKTKMLASRVEESDYFKFESLFKKDGKKLQEIINFFVVSCISGSIQLSGSVFISGEKCE